MSTYLLGWAIHEFVPDQLINSSGMFQMWTRRSMNHRGSIALDEGQSIFAFLNNWVAMCNPISKMDQVAVPDFNFHAMENWGMITYRESVVLYESGLTPTKYMIDGFTTMAHEYAHTWFGNLVTPMFWNVAWLKEGFASYFQYFAVSMVHPTWRMMDKFVVDMLQSAMLLDSADHNRVMNGRNVGSPSSIMAVLDFVSYKKGASVIRMLSHVIGESAFHKGLQDYVTYMSYQAATPSDLYKHLQHSINQSSEIQSDISIEEFMETWTNQSGYPLVTVTRNYETQTLTLFQERFRWDQDQSVSGWWIPLSFTTEELANFSNTSPSFWLKPEDEGLTLPFHVPSDDWLIFNLQHAGYYRVNYDQENWLMLTYYLNSKHFQKIHRANRAALVDDAFNLARAGYVNYSIPFDLCSYLVQELDYEPWVAAVNSIRFLNTMLNIDLKVQRAFQEYVDRLLRNMYEQLNFTESRNEDITTKLHRELILSTSCLIRSADCLNISKTLFKNWMTQPDITIPRDVKSFVYCEGIRDGNEEDWYRVLAKFQITDLQTEQELLLQGLGCTRNASLIKRYLELSISDEQNVHKQQRMMIVNAILDGNAGNLDHVMKFVHSNLKSIIDLRGHDFLGKVITAIGKAVTREKQARKLRTLVEEHTEELGPALDAAEQALSVALGNVEWINKYVPSIANYFEQHEIL
ncbi:Aminopeptidase N [Eufriesea mexicana]|uniref:Aminopeptidase N n=2 Tax=Eufriesea mexicana TaxID=516756 RepID=A0A310SKF7_9HYME|nr:Aminopeptidase N [Eufriesea mexicana]